MDEYSNYKTLIACLPNESKEILNHKEIIIPTPTSNSLLFNYATFDGMYEKLKKFSVPSVMIIGVY